MNLLKCINNKRKLSLMCHYIFRIMKDHINTYTFTKALAEHLINDAKDITTCIVRPSMSKYIYIIVQSLNKRTKQ